MRVILMSDQRHLGRRGQVVEVKPGYARNYLIPQGLALEATNANRAYFEQQKDKIDARHEREREAAAEVAARLAGLRLTVPKRVGETDTLYGSVTAGEVAALLAEQGIEVDRRRIDLEGGIKTLGDHPVRVELHH
ncbi:MAG: 50S ribosomal protein L9, partial [Thermoanaerobaculia bacterium]